MLRKILIFIFFSLQIFPVNLLLLKGTTKALPKSDYKYALYNGVPFAEGLSENLYQASVQDIALKINHEIKSSKESGQEVDAAKAHMQQYLQILRSTESFTSKLVATLYYRPVGGQFQMTAADNNPAKYLTPNHIGNILRLIAESLQSNAGKENLRGSLQEYLLSLKLKKASGSLFASKDFKPLLISLIGSLEECSKDNSKASFALGTTEGILLGYCLNKANTKEDLASFMTGLTGKVVSLSDQQYSKEEIKQIIAKGLDLENTQDFADWLISVAYDKKYNTTLPKIVPNKSILYQGVNFPDCVETTVRNLCNIATYDGSQLGAVQEGRGLSSSLDNFYKQNLAAVPAEVGNQSVHQAWGNVVENMVGASYNRLKVEAHQDNPVSIPSVYEGFMPVDDSLIAQDELKKLPIHKMSVGGQDVTLYEKIVGTAQYLLVPKDAGLSCYELLPTASNMVVSLNNLFNLHLYEPQAIFTVNFAQENFEKVCDKLDWKLQTAVTDNISSVDIKICKGSSCFQVGLSRKAHGAVTVLNSSNVDIIPQNSITAKSYEEHPEKIADIVSLMDTININSLFIQVDKNRTHFLKLLRDIDVRNPDTATRVIIEVLQLKLQNNEIDSYIERLIVGLPTHDIHYFEQVISICKNSSDVIKKALKSFLYRAIIKNDFDYRQESLVKLIIAFIENNIMTVQEAIPFLEKFMTSGEFNAQSLVLRWMNNLGEKNLLKAEEATSLLEKGMTIRNISTQELIANIINSLFKNNVLTVQEIRSFLEKSMINGNSEVRISVSNITSELVRLKVLSIQEEVSLLEKFITNGDSEVQRIAFNSIDFLFSINKLTTQEVMSLLEKGMASGNADIQQLIVKRIINLAKENKLPVQEAMPFFEKYIVDGNQGIQLSILSGVYYFSWYKKITSEETISFLEKAMASSNVDIQRLVLEKITHLAEAKILTVEEIQSFLQKGFSSSDNVAVDRSAKFALELVKKNILTKTDTLQMIDLLEKTEPSTRDQEKKEIVNLVKELQETLPTTDRLKYGALDAKQGFLRKTGMMSMRHQPTIADTYLKDLGMTSKEFAEKYADYSKAYSASMKHGQEGYDLADLEEQRQAIAEGQNRMQSNLDAYHREPSVSHFTGQRIQPIAVRLGQQRRMMAKDLLPKSTDVVRRGARSIVR